KVQRRLAILLERMIRRGEQLVQVHPRAEIAARAADRHDAHGGVEIGPLQHFEQRVDHRGVDRVALVGTIERRGKHAARNVDEDAVAHRLTSIVIRSSAVENTFPCASVLSEIVPPPSSAPCSRKFSAWRLGSSKRSTGPLIMPLK